MTQFQVVANAERQHSLWPVSRDLPVGWSPTGFRGHRAACLAHIDAVWTDIRPRSVIDQIDRTHAERRLVEQRSEPGRPAAAPAGRLAG